MCCFGIHRAQTLRYPKISCAMAFAGPRLLPTIAAIFANEVRLSYLLKAFTLWMRYYVRNVDGRPISFAVVKHSPHSYTFRCLIVRNCIPHQLRRWISADLTPFASKKYAQRCNQCEERPYVRPRCSALLNWRMKCYSPFPAFLLFLPLNFKIVFISRFTIVYHYPFSDI